MRTLAKKVLICLFMTASLVLSLASCDEIQNLIGDTKTSDEVYKEAKKRYDDAREKNEAVSINIVWITEENERVVIDLSYEEDSFSYGAMEDKVDEEYIHGIFISASDNKIYNYIQHGDMDPNFAYNVIDGTMYPNIGESITYTETIIYKDGKMYYQDKDGGKYSYDSTLDDVTRYVENFTYVNELQPAYSAEYPDSWFENTELQQVHELLQMQFVNIEIDDKKSKEHSKHSDVYVPGSECRLYFSEDGEFECITLTDVIINGVKSSVSIVFDWSVNTKIQAPNDVDKYGHKGEFKYDAGRKPGEDNRTACEKNGHTFSTVVTKPTCTEGGYTTYTCSVCGDEYIYNATKALGHKESEWIIDIGATCTENGSRHTACTVCGEILKSEVIAATDHSYSSIITEPTCTNDGYDAHTCINCGHSYTDNLTNALGHDYSSSICYKCGEKIYSEGIDYTLSKDGTYYIATGMGSCTDEDLVIAGVYNGLPVTEIGGWSFVGAGDMIMIKSVTLPDSIRIIGPNAFWGSSISSILIPEGVTVIGGGVFDNCWYLENITLPSTLTEIGDWAFISSGLTEITIPKNVAYIGDKAFAGCKSLQSIAVDDENEHYKSIDGNLYSKDGSVLVQHAAGQESTEFIVPDCVNAIGTSAFYYSTKLTKISVGNNVTIIDDSAFMGCLNLSSIIVPDGVTSIGSLAFSYCPSITDISLPDCVTSIGDSAFSGCSSLTCINIPNGVTRIGYDAFSGCSSLTSIIIPDSVTSIESGAFRGCSSLESITLPFLGSAVDSNGSVDPGIGYPLGILFGTGEYVGGTATVQHYFDGSTTTYNTYYIPSNLKHVTVKGGFILPEAAFENCSSLISVTIGNEIAHICPDAFNRCSNLTSVTMGNSINTIGHGAFDFCTGLTSIKIPDSVMHIGEVAFRHCTSLTEIIIPKSVYYLSEDAFDYTLNNKNVYYTGTEEEWTKLNIGEIGIVHYYSELEPTTAGNFWHYVDGVVTVWPHEHLLSEWSENNATCTANGTVERYCTIDGCGYLETKETSALGHNWAEATCDSPKTCLTCKIQEGSALGHTYIDSMCSICGANEYSEGIEYTLSSDGEYYIATGIGTCSDKNVIIANIRNGLPVKEIGESAFDGANITGITLPDSITKIGDSAFVRTSISEITIPKSVTSIGIAALAICENLVYINVDEANTVYTSIDGNLYSKDGNELITYAIGKNDTSFEIPNGVTSINPYAFCYCSKLENVIIPNGVTRLFEGAFSECSNLTYVTIPVSVTEIDGYVFEECTGLIDVYYTGTEEEWTVIDIGTSNECLTIATIHYNYNE